MTLCIAALCRDEGEPSVVLSFDTHVETAITSADTEIKLHHLLEGDGYGWIALLSGNDISLVRELCGVVGEFLQAHGDELSEANLETRMREPFNVMRRRLADVYTHQTASIPFEQFLSSGKTLLPDYTYQEMFQQISRQYVPGELIIIGWLPDANDFVLLTYHGDSHRVARELDFAVIGSGSTVALANLFQREQEASDTLERTLYAVFESQSNGTIAPAVGQYYQVAQLRRENNATKCQWLSNNGHARFDKLYERLKPRSIPEITIEPDDFSEDIND